MWNLKNKINDQTKQKQTHRQNRLIVAREEGDWGLVKNGEEIKEYKLTVRNKSQGYKIQHREYSQLYCNKYIQYWVFTRLIAGNHFENDRNVNHYTCI